MRARSVLLTLAFMAPVPASMLLTGQLGRGSDAGTKPAGPPPGTDTVAPGPSRDDTIVAVVVPTATAEIVPPVAGAIVAVQVNIGDRVRKNDLLATLDSRLTAADLAAAQAAAVSQRVEQKMAESAREAAVDRERRIVVLAEKGVLPETDLQTAVEESEQARLRVEANQSLVAQRVAQVRRLSDEKRLLEVRAPFDGVVVARYVDPGGAVSLVPPRPIIRLSSGRLLLRMAIPARRLDGVALGTRVIALSEGGRERIEGRIERLAPQVDPASNTLVAETSVDRTVGTVAAGLVMEASLLSQ